LLQSSFPDTWQMMKSSGAYTCVLAAREG
jgi:hypothetical protein